MANKLPVTTYRGLRIVPYIIDKTGDYESCRFDVFLDDQRYLAFIESVTGTAAKLISGDRNNAGQIAFDLGTRRLHGLIDIGELVDGETVEHWRTGYDETSKSSISDENVRTCILQALYRGMRHNPTGYKYERTDVDGFCEVLGINKKSFEFNAALLFDQGQIQRTPGDQYSLRDGAICITSKGVEYVEKAAAINNKNMLSKVRILFLAADPTNESRLRLGQEFRDIQEKLKLAQLRDNFQLELPQLSLRSTDLSQAMLDTQPQIVHFSGHGSSTGEIFFENLMGESHPIQPDALAALFEQFAHQVQCVILNACYSENQAIAIAKHVEYVIGMSQAIGDEAAIAFAVGFYQALGAGRTLEEAYRLGCVQIRLQGIPEHLTPVLFKKAELGHK